MSVAVVLLLLLPTFLRVVMLTFPPVSMIGEPPRGGGTKGNTGVGKMDKLLNGWGAEGEGNFIKNIKRLAGFINSVGSCTKYQCSGAGVAEII